MSKINFYAGVFVFNPLDDESHLERIEKNITSICIARDTSPLSVFVDVLLNKSIVDNGSLGVGPRTQKLVDTLQDKYGFQVRDYTEENSCARGYRNLLSYGHQTDAPYVAVFADDYIIPSFWFDTMVKNFNQVKDASFMVASTCNVAQTHLINSFTPHPSWDIRVASKGDHNRLKYETTYAGVEIEHIETIAASFLNQGIVPFSPPPSFETTVFKKELLDSVGYIRPEYYSIFYDTDYFDTICRSGAKGYIAKNCFAFHYGKGGTKALYKDTADEKYANSPYENKLLSDLEFWNKRSGNNIQPWWGSK